MKWLKTLMIPLSEAADAGSGSGASNADAGAAAAAAAGTAGNNGSAAGAAGSEGAARTGAASTGFTYKEDRSDWVPKHRFNEVNTKAQTYEAQIKERDDKIAALAGLKPAEPGSEQAKAIDAAFRKQYPQLVPLLGLTAEQIENLTRTPERVSEATDAEKRQWARHGKTQMKAIYSQVAEHIGADELSADQQADVTESFRRWFRDKCAAEMKAAGSEDVRDSATFVRYEEGDESLREEFVKRHVSNWVEPARRKVTATTVNNRTRPVPNSSGRSQVQSVQRPEQFKTLDERLDYAAKLYKERGGQFSTAS